MRRFVMLLLLGLTLGAVPAWAEPAAPQPQPMKTPEVLTSKPSGFWTSNRPAEGGAYRWRLLGIGVAILAVTGYSMLRLVKRASASRAAGEPNARRLPGS